MFFMGAFTYFRASPIKGIGAPPPMIVGSLAPPCFQASIACKTTYSCPPCSLTASDWILIAVALPRAAVVSASALYLAVKAFY